MTRRGSCVKLNADYTLARSRPVCPRRPLPAAISFTPFSPFARCTFPHQRLNRAVPVHEPRGEDVLRNRCLLSNIFLHPVSSPSRYNDRARARSHRRARRIPRIRAQVRYLKAQACLPTVITCRLAGRDKNPPIAINHGELEKTARGNAHRACIYTHLFRLSSSLSPGFLQSFVRARNFSRRSAAARVRFLPLGRRRDRLRRGDFPLIAVKRDTLRPGQNIGISFETRYSCAVRLPYVPRLRSETLAEVRNTIAFAHVQPPEGKREREIYCNSDVISCGRK